MRNKKCREAECNTIFGERFSQKGVDTVQVWHPSCGLPDCHQDRHSGQELDFLPGKTYPILRSGPWKQEGRPSPSGVKILPFGEARLRRVGLETKIKQFRNLSPIVAEEWESRRGYSRAAYKSDPFGFILSQTAFSQTPRQSPSQLRCCDHPLDASTALRPPWSRLPACLACTVQWPLACFHFCPQ